MIQKYRVGDISYLIESGRYIREGKITYICGDIITFKFTDCRGATKVKAHRLFPTEEAASNICSSYTILRKERRATTSMAVALQLCIRLADCQEHII